MTHHFAGRDAVRRYLSGRPAIHVSIIEKIRKLLKLTAPVKRAVDVGCGTGQSTLALKTIADHVVGVDLSPEMLKAASAAGGVTYVRSSAEALPIGDGSVTLMTVALAIHWFDRERFLAEASRVLEPHGWLVIYNHAFMGEMFENREFTQWWRREFHERFPKPQRDGRPIRGEELQCSNLYVVVDMSDTIDVVFTLNDLVAHLLSLSHIAAALESGRESIEGARGWLVSSLAPFFKGSQGTFPFGGPIWCLQKAPEE